MCWKGKERDGIIGGELSVESLQRGLNLLPSIPESGAVYEVKLVAYNGNGESDGSPRLVSLVEENMSEPSTGEYGHSL